MEDKKPTHAVIELPVFEKLSKFIVEQPYEKVAELVEELRGSTKFADLSQKEPKEEPQKEEKNGKKN